MRVEAVAIVIRMVLEGSTASFVVSRRGRVGVEGRGETRRRVERSGSPRACTREGTTWSQASVRGIVGRASVNLER